MGLRATMIDKMPMLDSVAIRAEKNEVIEAVVLAVPVLVVEPKNLRMLGISAPLAFVNRPAPALETSPESVVGLPKRSDGCSTFLAAIESFVCVALLHLKFLATMFAVSRFSLKPVPLFIRTLSEYARRRAAHIGAIGFIFYSGVLKIGSAMSAGNDSSGDHIIAASAFEGAESRHLANLGNVELFPTLFAVFGNAALHKWQSLAINVKAFLAAKSVGYGVSVEFSSAYFARLEHSFLHLSNYCISECEVMQ